MKKREATYRLELRGEVKKRRKESFAFRDCNVRLALEWCSHFLGDFLFYTRNEKCEIRKKSLIYEEREGYLWIFVILGFGVGNLEIGHVLVLLPFLFFSLVFSEREELKEQRESVCDG